ncbi:hypothetical protein CU311_06840 [Prochlorococcus marinus str. MU1402]|uniref:3-dehydroquinate synthase family protein n=1 Tax=Prochlorococcus marinus TaxID=1219 RepID=UPI001ADC216F|nr:hypothetical protein [Prochlorococcus marinus]MBO8232395.1 3-dehydroquinate synthase [Prochlorococcus marinus XMU1402]MBW3057123.1 hypothetical protein [Prochlorococcus marinus str. MU1402]
MRDIEAYSDTSYSYKIILTSELEDIEQIIFDKLKKYPLLVVFIDNGITRIDPANNFLEMLQRCANNAGSKLIKKKLESGKHRKTLSIINDLTDWLVDRCVQRDSLFIAMGGGVVGDVVGLLSSLYFRGISLWHVPTNMLSMSDSSIGGKTGVNTTRHVNTLGTYKHPELNIMYTKFIDTIPDREFYAGLAEIIKISLLKKGPLFNLLNSVDSKDNKIRSNPKLLEEILFHSIRYKLFFTKDDIEENSKRLFLNVGHTFGHSIESIQSFNSEEYYRHGEAVALGLVVCARLSKIILNSHIEEVILSILPKFNLPIKLTSEFIKLVSEKDDFNILENLTETTLMDKKGLNGELRLILFDNYSQPVIYKTNNMELISKAYRFIVPF